MDERPATAHGAKLGRCLLHARCSLSELLRWRLGWAMEQFRVRRNRRGSERALRRAKAHEVAG